MKAVFTTSLCLSLNNFLLASGRMAEIQVPFSMTQKIERHVVASVSKIKIFNPQFVMIWG